MYFVGFTTESQPNDDIDAVENREWLFQAKMVLFYYPKIESIVKQKGFYSAFNIIPNKLCLPRSALKFFLKQTPTQPAPNPNPKVQHYLIQDMQGNHES